LSEPWELLCSKKRAMPNQIVARRQSQLMLQRPVRLGGKVVPASPAVPAHVRQGRHDALLSLMSCIEPPHVLPRAVHDRSRMFWSNVQKSVFSFIFLNSTQIV
jgi:hypothetical protein